MFKHLGQEYFCFTAPRYSVSAAVAPRASGKCRKVRREGGESSFSDWGKLSLPGKLTSAWLRWAGKLLPSLKYLLIKESTNSRTKTISCFIFMDRISPKLSLGFRSLLANDFPWGTSVDSLRLFGKCQTCYSIPAKMLAALCKQFMRPL